MSGLPQDALRTAILKTLADDVQAALNGGKAELDQLMESLGVKSLTATLPDGTEAGTVTRVGGKEAPRITSPGKFLAWVSEVHPEQTETVVRPGYAEALLSSMRKAGRPIDPATGEVVPGVEMAETSSYLTVRFASGDVPGREHIRRAWRDGTIALPALLELPAGEARPVTARYERIKARRGLIQAVFLLLIAEQELDGENASVPKVNRREEDVEIAARNLTNAIDELPPLARPKGWALTPDGETA